MSRRERRQPEVKEVWARRRQRQEPAVSPTAMVALGRACRRYREKLQQGQMRTRKDGDVRGQFARYADYQRRQQQLALLVNQVLCERGVPVHLFFWYQNFCRHVTKVIGQHDGQTRGQLVLGAVQRWVGMGLTLSVLEEICARVLNFPVTGYCLGGPDGSIILRENPSKSGPDRPEDRPATQSTVGTLPEGDEHPGGGGP